MIDDFADVIAELGETFTARRGTAPTFDAAGRAIDPAPGATFSIVASVQPISGEELKRLPEGERSEDLRELYTTAELHTANPAAGTRADEVIIEGEAFEVERVHPWRMAGFTKCIVRRINR